MLGYTGPDVLILSNNLSSAHDAPEVLDNQLDEDLRLGRVCAATPTQPFISSPLGLVPKSDNTLRRIHHLSFPSGRSVNDNIPAGNATLRYTAVTDIFEAVRRAGRGAVLIKRDLKDAFRMIPVAPQHRWLLGFSWRGNHYTEKCLPFGLRTAPFLFNLFAEGLHWTWLASAPPEWLVQLIHYLDDFIAILPPGSDPAPMLQLYLDLCWLLGLVDNTKKAAHGTCVECLGIEIDTLEMTARLPRAKILKGTRLVEDALTQGRLTQLETERITGFLVFCASVLPLGRTFLARLWNFHRSFKDPRAHRPLTIGAVRDLEWWRDTLPLASGLRLLDDAARKTFHLYTDASSFALGGFWYEGNPADRDWKVHSVPQGQAFACPRSNNPDTTSHTEALTSSHLQTHVRTPSHGRTAPPCADKTHASHGHTEAPTSQLQTHVWAPPHGRTAPPYADKTHAPHGNTEALTSQLQTHAWAPPHGRTAPPYADKTHAPHGNTEAPTSQLQTHAWAPPHGRTAPPYADGQTPTRTKPYEGEPASSRVDRDHINTAEINAIVTALRLWLSVFAGGFVIIHTDNTTAEAAFGSGTTRGTASMDLLRDAIVLAATADIKLYACRISSEDNGLADALSRFEWEKIANLCPQWTNPLECYHQSISAPS